MFGCRTNGTLVWDRLRALYGMSKDDYGPAEEALQKVVPGENLIFWQPRDESFPVSGAFDIVRIGDAVPGFESDYCGLVESSLAAVYLHSRDFARPKEPLLHVVGGATGSLGVMRRVAAIWNRPVVPIGEAGAALGASVAGVRALLKSEGAELGVEGLSEALVQRGAVIDPLPEDVAAFHRPGGYLDRFAVEEASLLQRHQIRTSLPA